MSDLLTILPSVFSHTFVPSLQGASDAAASSLFSLIWQSALLAGTLALILKLTPRTTASLRFALWSTAFVASLLLPFAAMLPHLWEPHTASSTTLVPAASGAPWMQLDERWSLALGALWLAASLYRLVALAAHSLRLRRLWVSAIPVDSTGPSFLVSAHRPAQICTTTQLDRPGVIGFFSPRILVPEWLYAQLSPAELKQIVLHESEHLRRRDDWTNLFQKLCLVLFPLNPVLLFMERQLCLEREMACDEGVIESTHAPRAYATCLTRLAERGIQHRSEALALGAWQRRPELARRVHSILRNKPSLRPLSAKAMVIAVACSLLFGSLELSHAPRLIAFVPLQSNQLAAGSTAMSDASSLRTVTPGHPARFVNTAMSLSQRPQLIQLRANLPVQSRICIGDGVRPSSPERHPAPRLRVPSRTPMHVVPVSTTAPPASENASVEPQEQWIVLTTWQQQPSEFVETAQDDSRPPSQTIVTQLVFHVIAPQATGPKNGANTSAQPSARHADLISLPPRTGWLFFQL